MTLLRIVYMRDNSYNGRGIVSALCIERAKLVDKQYKRFEPRTRILKPGGRVGWFFSLRRFGTVEAMIVYRATFPLAAIDAGRCR